MALNRVLRDGGGRVRSGGTFAAPAPTTTRAPVTSKPMGIDYRQPGNPVIDSPSYTGSLSTRSSTPPSGGGGSYGGGGGGSYDVGVTPVAPPVVTPPSEEDYLAGDSGYTTQLSALQSALQRYIADSDFQRKNYETDYGKSLRDLGYDEGKKAWNWTDQLTASGRGYQNQLNDFGARGMLQSSGYADAFNELQRMLGQQYDSLSSAKTNYMTDLDNQIANYKGENTASQQAARAEALARRAAQYGV